MAVAILHMVRPWSASPKRESISVSSPSAALTSAQALSKRDASSSFVIMKRIPFPCEKPPLPLPYRTQPSTR